MKKKPPLAKPAWIRVAVGHLRLCVHGCIQGVSVIHTTVFRKMGVTYITVYISLSLYQYQPPSDSIMAEQRVVSGAPTLTLSLKDCEFQILSEYPLGGNQASFKADRDDLCRRPAHLETTATGAFVPGAGLSGGMGLIMLFVAPTSHTCRTMSAMDQRR